MVKIKIGFTGTRRGMTAAQTALVNFVLSGWGSDAEFHHGDCIGADKTAHGLAIAAGCRVVLHPPIDPSKRAGCVAHIVLPVRNYLDRNHDIVDATDELIATPGGATEQLCSGTWATIRYARRCGKLVTVIYPDGDVGT